MLKHIIWITLVSTSLTMLRLDAHFLWKVDTEQPSFLYGTIHSSDAAVRDLPPPVIDALKKSRSFHPEIELSPENIGHLTGAIFATGTTDLEDELPPALWDRFVSIGQSVGIPPLLLRRVPLELAPMIFATPPDSDFNRIVDVQVYQLAKDNGLHVHALETIEEQIGIFRAFTRDQALAFLEESLKEFEAGFPTQKKMIALYATGDLEELHRLMHEELERTAFPELTDALLDQRNHRMTERLLPFLETGGAFVAIGAGHMPGEEGMVALLERKGYRVARVAVTEPVESP